MGVILGKAFRIADGGKAQGQVGGGAAQGIAFLHERGERRGPRPCAGQHMSQSRMHRQGGKLAAMGGDPGAVERAKIGQKRARLGQGRGRGRRQEGEVGAVAAPKCQFEGKAGEVGGRDLGRREGR